MEPVPTIHELTVPAAPIARRRDRLSLVVIAVLGALVGFGFMSAAVTDGTGPCSAEPTPFPSTLGALIIDEPAEGATVRGAEVGVSGRIPSDVEQVEVVARAGRMIVGRAVVDGVDGRFTAHVVVAVPGDGRPVPVTIEATAIGGSGVDPLTGRRAIAIVGSAPVALTTVRPIGGPGVVAYEVAGIASQLVTSIDLESPRRVVTATLRGGRWTATLDARSVDARVPVTLRWTAADGTGGSIWLTVAPSASADDR